MRHNETCTQEVARIRKMKPEYRCARDDVIVWQADEIDSLRVDAKRRGREGQKEAFLFGYRSAIDDEGNGWDVEAAWVDFPNAENNPRNSVPEGVGELREEPDDKNDKYAEVKRLREEIEVMDRHRRKLQSEIDSLMVDANRQDKLGTVEEIYRAGWGSGWVAGYANSQYERSASDWEVYQLDRARTQEVSDEDP